MGFELWSRLISLQILVAPDGKIQDTKFYALGLDSFIHILFPAYFKTLRVWQRMSQHCHAGMIKSKQKQIIWKPPNASGIQNIYHIYKYLVSYFNEWHITHFTWKMLVLLHFMAAMHIILWHEMLSAAPSHRNMFYFFECCRSDGFYVESLLVASLNLMGLMMEGLIPKAAEKGLKIWHQISCSTLLSHVQN